MPITLSLLSKWNRDAEGEICIQVVCGHKLGSDLSNHVVATQEHRETHRVEVEHPSQT